MGERRRVCGRTTLLLFVKGGIGLLVLCSLSAAAAGAQPLEFEPVASGLSMPILATHAGDGSGRLFLVEQGGVIRVWDAGAVLATPFLDLSSDVSCCAERGLLGLAFHPRFASNGRFFVNYTDGGGDTVISEFTVSSDPNVADGSSERELLTFDQPFSNHNGGHLAFGPDGYLYIASGDGGDGGDPQNNGQDLDSLLGKLLRIDPDTGDGPGDNPFADGSGREEIWAYGLRNPWRFSFDRRTGDLYLGDVGQNAIEEIDFQPSASAGGENYGWRLTEGSACFNPASNCDDGSLTPPILEYDHSEGCSVTAGYRYRGPAEHTLPRFFFYGDFCSGRIWGGLSDQLGNWRARELVNTSFSISSFGEDEAGEVYVVDYSGTIYRLVGRPTFASDFESGGTRDWSQRRGGLEVVQPGLAKSENALEVPVDGSSTARFLRSREPTAESSFYAEFRINANRVDLGGGEVEILRLEGSSDPVVLTLQQDGRKYFVRLWAVDGGELTLVGRTKVPRRRAKRIAVELLVERGNGNDGEVRLRKNGRAKLTTSGLDNHGLFVESVSIGLPSGAEGTVSGSFLIDDYRSSP